MSITSTILAALPAVLLKSTFLLLAALAATALLRRAPAATRHLVWLAALLGVLALPVLEAVVPAWRVVPALPTLHLTPAPPASPVDDPIGLRQGEAARTPALAGTAAADAPAAAAAETAPRSVSSRVVQTPTAARAPLRAGPTLVGIWLLGAALLLARLAYGLARVRWLERRAVEVTDDAWLHLADRLSRRLGLGRIVRLLRAPDASVPMTWGTLRPVVLLPEAAERWSDERRRVVLAHELAHVRRWDAATQWVAHLAVCLFWFHPLVWVAARRLRAEGEQACDDAVLEIGTRPTEYADHLLALVRSLGAAQGPVAALAMARRSQFEGRLLAILDSATRRGRVSRAAALAVATAAVLAVLPLAAVRAAEPVAAPTAEADQVQAEDIEANPVVVESVAPEPAAGASDSSGEAHLPGMPEAREADLSGVAATARATRTDSDRAEALAALLRESRPDTVPRPAATRIWRADEEVEGEHHGEPSYSLRLRARDVEVAAGAPEVVGIRPGGSLSIEHTLHAGYPDPDPLRPQGSRATLTRSLQGTPAADGSIRWRYAVNGAERPFDAEGRAWLAALLRKRKWS